MALGGVLAHLPGLLLQPSLSGGSGDRAVPCHTSGFRQLLVGSLSPTSDGPPAAAQERGTATDRGTGVGGDNIWDLVLTGTCGVHCWVPRGARPE